MALILSNIIANKGHFIVVVDASSVGTKWTASEIEDGVPTRITGTAANTSSITIGNATIVGSEGSGGTNDRIYTVTGVTGDIYVPDTSGNAIYGATISDPTTGQSVQFSTVNHPACIVIEVK